MAAHEAAGQMMGYLYQVRYAMLLLLESENPPFKISIEKFDDNHPCSTPGVLTNQRKK